MRSLDQQVEDYGHDIGGGWTAYGYILYRDDYRISLDDRIEPGDGFDSIADWTEHLEGKFGQNAALAFNRFVTRIFRDPWPKTKPAIRDRLMAEGVTHSKWRSFSSRND